MRVVRAIVERSYDGGETWEIVEDTNHHIPPDYKFELKSALNVAGLMGMAPGARYEVMHRHRVEVLE